MAAGNKTLGRFELSDIPPAPRGVPRIEVKFDIDANGIVHVSAKDLGTGKEQKITIQSDSNMSKEDIDRMVKEAEAHAAEDKKQKEKIEIRNNADALVYQAEKALTDIGDKADKAQTDKIRASIDNLKEKLKGTDDEAIKQATEDLQKLIYELSAAAYQAAGGAQPGQETPQDQKPADDNVVDAEYKVMDDDKK